MIHRHSPEMGIHFNQEFSMTFKEGVGSLSASVLSHMKALVKLNQTHDPLQIPTLNWYQLNGVETALMDLLRLTKIVKSHPASGSIRDYTDPILSTKHNILWFGPF